MLPVAPEEQPAFEAFCQEISCMQLISEGPYGMPALRYLADPPGKRLAQAYLALHPRQETPTGPHIPVLYLELPPAARRRPGSLLPLFLKQLGLPLGTRTEDQYDKADRFIAGMHTAQVELTILVDFHHLIEDNGDIREIERDWITGLFKTELKAIPLLAVGERAALQQLVCSTGQMARLFHPIRLPGEPPAPEDRAARKRLRALLGLPPLQDDEPQESFFPP